MRDIVENIVQSVNEETTSAAIAYLPGGFVPVKKAFSALAKVKKKWGISILDKEPDYHFDLEDKLTVIVPKQHSHTFKQDSGINDFGMKEIDLSPYVLESVIEAQTDASYNTTLINQIEDALYAVMAKSPIDTLGDDVKAWALKFPGRYLPVKKSSLNTNTIEKDVDALMKQIGYKFSDDRGELELLLEAIKTQQSLARFDLFRSYQYLWAGVIESKYRGVRMIFEAIVDNKFDSSERIYLTNKDVLESLEGLTLIKIGKGVVYPVGGRFQQNFFTSIQNAIDEQ